MITREKVSGRKATKAAKGWVREQRDFPRGVYARFRGWVGSKRNYEVGYDTPTGIFIRILNLRIGDDYRPVVERDRRARRGVPAFIFGHEAYPPPPG